MERLHQPRIAACITILIFASVNNLAHGQDQCRDILSAGLFNQSTTINSLQKTQALHDWACSHSYSETRSSWAAHADGNYMLIAGGDVDFNEGNFNTWKQDNCHESSSSNSLSSFDYHAQRSVANGIVKAWSACMIKESGLVCWMEPNVGDNLTFHIQWNDPLGGRKLKVTESWIQEDGGSKRTLLKAGSLIGTGPTLLHFQWSKNHGSITAGLNSVLSHTNQACESSVLGSEPKAKGFQPLTSPVALTLQIDKCAMVDGVNNCEPSGQRLVAKHICRDNSNPQYRTGPSDSKDWKIEAANTNNVPGSGVEVAHWETTTSNGPDGEVDGKWVHRHGYATFTSVNCYP